MNDHGIIDLLRHGETTAGKCFLGSTNTSLTEKGWRQMRNAVSDPVYDMVITSPLLRCMEFAKDYSEKYSLPLLIEDDLREIHFGEWEGKTSEQLWQTDQRALLDFWNDPLNNTPPKGEDMSAFVMRVNKSFTNVWQQFRNKNILLVSHAGVIKVMICHVLGMNPGDMQKLIIDHGGMSRIMQWQQMQVGFINRQVVDAFK